MITLLEELTPVPEPKHDRYQLQEIAVRAQACADDIKPLIDSGDRGRALSIARTQIELGAAMLLRAVDL